MTFITYHARSVRQLTDRLRQLSIEKRLRSPNSILLFALAPSSSTPPEVLSEITSTLTNYYPEHVGCISAPLPLQHLDSRTPPGAGSWSLACALIDAVSFRSTIPGRAEVQVGRWHAARRGTEDADGSDLRCLKDPELRNFSDSDGKVNWDGVWDWAASPLSRSTNIFGALPDALRDLDPLAVENILYFSDKQPEGLANLLEEAFPQANKLSLIASSTPFITGRPVTLFHNGSILSKGAVGAAFGSSASLLPMIDFSLPPLIALSGNLTVTSSEGNLILSLDYGNPSKLLLGAVQKHGILFPRTTFVAKEDEFYVGVTNPSGECVSQLHRITAGDPSRGTIALDAVSAPRVGSVVRLYHLPSETGQDVPTSSMPVETPNISLIVSPETNLPSCSDGIAEDTTATGDCLVVSDAFLAASENGYTVSQGTRGELWKCVVPGARVGLTLR